MDSNDQCFLSTIGIEIYNNSNEKDIAFVDDIFYEGI